MLHVVSVAKTLKNLGPFKPATYIRAILGALCVLRTVFSALFFVHLVEIHSATRADRPRISLRHVFSFFPVVASIELGITSGIDLEKDWL